MVYVRLNSDWTDANGVSHSAGDMVDVDAGTLAMLQADGIVSEGSSTGDKGDSGTDWAGPGSSTEGWAGPGSATP